jgi:hypothetical protein
VSVKADAISIAISNDETLLFKTLGLQEALPAVDPFLIYSNSKNREFLEGYQLITNAYEVAATTITYIHTLSFPFRIGGSFVLLQDGAAHERVQEQHQGAEAGGRGKLEQQALRPIAGRGGGLHLARSRER